MIDQKDGVDNYSIITLLRDQFDIKLVSDETVEKISKLLLEIVKDNPFLRALLIKRYGFDIFNPDGTINYERLIMALLIDGISPDDLFDLFAFIEICERHKKLVTFLGKIFAVLCSLKTRPYLFGTLGFGLIIGLGSILRLSTDDSSNTMDSNDIDNPLFPKEKYYPITKEAWDSFPLIDKETIKQEMKEVGYTEDNINCLENGKIAVLDETLRNLYKTLQNIMKEHPTLKDAIEGIYNFQLLSDNNINMDKLATLLVIDYRKSSDPYDICQIVYENCKEKISIETHTEELIRIAQLALDTHEGLRNEIIDEDSKALDPYGKINKNKLLFMLLDRE